MPALEAEVGRLRELERNPALLLREADETFAVRNGQPISGAQFLADVFHCAEQLPDARYLINLCGDRYRFSTAFFAAGLRGQTTLLPAQRGSEAIAILRKRFEHTRVVADSAEDSADALIDFAPGQNGTYNEPERLRIDPAHTIAIAFTSGSTGAPQAHAKSWALLASGRATHARYLTMATDAPIVRGSGLIATVPSWHMYGLEWAMLLPTIAPLTLHSGADFFPGDVVAALNSFPHQADTILVSTPTHLRALAKAPPPDRDVKRTVCATAPLDSQLITATEQHLRTTMFEIYGCSEIGSLASRAPASDTGWVFFDNLDVRLVEGKISVTTPLIDTPVILADRFAALADNRYELRGRATDLIKVGGKRESLANLNSMLLALPGIDDGVIYQPSILGIGTSERLAAFVVGDNLNPQTIRNALAAQIDSVFVPRPVRVVDALPRDTTSKLKMADLKALAISVAENTPDA